jgi:hypothetical protein
MIRTTTDLSQLKNKPYYLAGADCQYSDGPHGYEVLPEYNNAIDSPLPVPLPAIPGDSLYRNCIVFLPYLVISVYCFSLMIALTLVVKRQIHQQ